MIYSWSASSETLMDPSVLTKLRTLTSQPKFVDESGIIYSGIRPAKLRLSAEAQLNELIERVVHVADDKSPKALVISEFRKALARFPAYDTEDRERMCRYLVPIMEIVGIKNSGGLLIRWLYGPILGSLIWLRHRSN